MLNRGLVTVLVKEPFREWLQTLPEPCYLTLEELNRDTVAYLVPEFFSERDHERVIREFFSLIFDDRLSAWWPDKDEWPLRRDLHTFRRWFELRIHSVIEDLVEEALVDE